MIVVDVAHACWHAWKARTSVSGAFDRLRGRLRDVAALGERVVLVADAPPYDRAAIFPPYKANRRDDAPGREAVRGFLQALKRDGWTVVSEKGAEADDMIASIVAESERRQERVTVITGDKDLWCLANRCALRDFSDEVVDAAAVVERWKVRPELLLDVLALAGDTSDNVPGAAQVGPHAAALLLEQYGTLSAILAAETPAEEQIAADVKELERLRRARKKAEGAAKGAPDDATLDAEAQAAVALAAEKGRAVERAKALLLVHASRENVELSARLVALREDLALDFDAIFYGRASSPTPADPGRHPKTTAARRPQKEAKTMSDDPSYMDPEHTSAALAPRAPEQQAPMVRHGHEQRSAPPAQGPAQAPMGPRTSDRTEELYQALARAQLKYARVEKTRPNDHFKSKYANLGDVMDAVLPALKDEGILPMQIPAGNRLFVRIVHGTSGQWIEGSLQLIAPDQRGGIQALGSALTYTRRYLLTMMLGIVAFDEDDDGNAAQGHQGGSRRPAA